MRRQNPLQICGDHLNEFLRCCDCTTDLESVITEDDIQHGNNASRKRGGTSDFSSNSSKTGKVYLCSNIKALYRYEGSIFFEFLFVYISYHIYFKLNDLNVKDHISKKYNV